MQKQNVRVVLASEHPQMRHFLSEVIEKEDGIDITGQARDANKALTLVKNLRPDVAVVDCYLPYDAGLEAIPMSRINGLDTAQAILEEIPNTRVLLLSNLNAEALPGGNLNADNTAFFSREKNGVNIPVTLQGLYQEMLLPGAVVFADVGVKQLEPLQQQVTRISDKFIFFGALGLAAGWLLTLTIFLAWPVGVFLALTGGVTVLLGLAGKLIASSQRKIRRGSKGDS